MNPNDREALLSLYSIPGIGPARMRSLISCFGSAQNVLDAPVRQLMEIRGVTQNIASKIKNEVNEAFVKSQIDMLKLHDADLISYWDAEYPERLKSIYDPPAFLFVKGHYNTMLLDAIGIVGTRTPSPYGKNVTVTMAREMVAGGLAVFSGFARGVDTLAHQATVDAGGATLAVLGNGLDIIYPAENKKLYERVLERGLFVTEYPFGTKPDAGNFPKRNRIISGLSLGILITEAGAKSGALLTAMYALDQNRDIFAVPGPIHASKSAGCNELIKQGAKLVQGPADIMSELSGRIAQNNEPVKPKPKLNEPAKTLYGLLDGEALHIDQLALKAGISTSEALSALLMLELNGLVRQMAGKMFTRL